MKRISLMALLFIFLSNNAFALVCDREQYSATGFIHSKAAESWFPKILYINDKRFKVSDSNPDRMVYRRKVWSESGKVRKTQLFILLPNGKLTSLLPKISGYKSTGNAQYKCTTTSFELKKRLGLE